MAVLLAVQIILNALLQQSFKPNRDKKDEDVFKIFMDSFAFDDRVCSLFGHYCFLRKHTALFLFYFLCLGRGRRNNQNRMNGVFLFNLFKE